MYSISHNVQYLAKLHRKNAQELRETRETNKKLVKEALRLEVENTDLKIKHGEMK